MWTSIFPVACGARKEVLIQKDGNCIYPLLFIVFRNHGILRRCFVTWKSFDGKKKLRQGKY